MRTFTATTSLIDAPLSQQSRNTPASPATLPTLDDTHALLVDAARSACSLRLRFGSQMPWGASKKAALSEVAASPVYKQHERNWSKLIKMERIHQMRRTTDGCFYLPGFLLTRIDGDWTINQQAVAHFVAAGAEGQAS